MWWCRSQWIFKRAALWTEFWPIFLGTRSSSTTAVRRGAKCSRKGTGSQVAIDMARANRSREIYKLTTQAFGERRSNLHAKGENPRYRSPPPSEDGGMSRLPRACDRVRIAASCSMSTFQGSATMSIGRTQRRAFLERASRASTRAGFMRRTLRHISSASAGVGADPRQPDPRFLEIGKLACKFL